MRIPDRNLAGWSSEVVAQCLASRDQRIQRGAMYRNLYLTGDAGGDPQIYPRTYSFIDNLSSFLYSPVELKFGIEHYGMSSASERAKGRCAASEMHKYLRRGNVDTEIEDAVTWSLVKGKAIIQTLWGEEGFEPYLIQPEMFGVLREDIDSLDRQEAFVHTAYFTKSRFAEMVANRPDRNDVMKKVQKYIKTERAGNAADANNKLKQVIIGGINPYQQAGSAKAAKTRGMVDWLGGPSPTLSPEVLQGLIRIDELWIVDDEREDYTTIQLVGDDIILIGENTHRNIFADMFDPENKEKSPKANPNNPLTGHHPFNEICPNRLTGYFWGRSEICNIALLQECINQRIDGINNILRRQENPPRAFIGGSAPNQNQYNKLNKAGGYMALSEPNAKIQTLAPELPSDMWVSLHEYENMFDQMAGFTPTMSGRGEAGVRAQSQAETLVKMASPRFKDRALIVERQVEGIGGKALDMLKAKVAEPLTAWVMPKDENIESSVPLLNELDTPPVKGMKPIQFTFHDLGDECRVIVDSHSSSPAFSGETRALMFDLFKLGLAKGETLLQHTQPPGAETMIEDLHEKEIAAAQFAQQHPEIAAEQEAKAAKNKK